MNNDEVDPLTSEETEQMLKFGMMNALCSQHVRSPLYGSVLSEKFCRHYLNVDTQLILNALRAMQALNAALDVARPERKR